ncbi:hypothetical protein BgramDRAFT_2149 [Paraburkholderia graminis C4D1M]|uniref:Uncharacterized protein n=1 Tax=Paraburkholderia graminis (strain ATCC 700544 / DSM 17151 / LMG 18924 / NCIMB 13744 / C4D1M) TaxID=396598 RepID=B1FYD1_PARG4|nr:hypothetical protein BgramDRAFT_2149 [Paraburkholderia graminis C4D1M]
MRQLGAVGDMMGYDFIDLAGHPRALRLRTV